MSYLWIKAHHPKAVWHIAQLDECKVDGELYSSLRQSMLWKGCDRTSVHGGELLWGDVSGPVCQKCERLALQEQKRIVFQAIDKINESRKKQGQPLLKREVHLVRLSELPGMWPEKGRKR